MTKEDVVSSFKPVIEQLSKGALEKLIEMNNADIIPYHVAMARVTSMCVILAK